MAIWFPTPIKTSAPAGGCRPCTTNQILCPDYMTLQIGCGNCNVATILAYRYLGVLNCWPGSGHCNPNLCCPWMFFDPWVDYRNGAWVSSTVIQVYADCGNGGPQATTLRASMWPTTRTKSISTGGAPGCGSTLVGSVTIFDDGTFTLA
jgi:hypothetical protein